MKRREVTMLGAVLIVALGGMGGLVAAGAGRENPQAVALLTEIVELQRKRVDTLAIQRQITADPTPEFLVAWAGAVEDLCNARVQLAHERSSGEEERQAIVEALESLREIHSEAEGFGFRRGPDTLATLRIPILEAELRLVRLGE